MSDDLDLAPGQLFAGRYRLNALIGRGGMGMVWRAQDEPHDRAVALKIITPRGPDGRASANAVGRFTREARAMARLRSPHVVRVLDHGSDERLAYITMELLDGVSLRLALKRRGKLNAEQTLRVMTQVSRAVALAHQRGIVHRDLKPGNIFLCDYPRANFISKVLDFGMAKSMSTPLSTVDQVRTRRGKPVGTPYYMSPEQARGTGNVDHRSDLWAMGVVAYECLCGRRPFTGKSLVEVLTAITGHTPTRPSELAEVPPAFDAWLSRALQRDVQQRFQTVHALLAELREALGADKLGATAFRPASSGLGTQTRLPSPGFGDRTVKRDNRYKGNSFVGREHELAALDEARITHCRVLSLVGRAGSGRGRLGRAYASRCHGELPGGVWICTADGLAEDADLWLRLAATLDARLSDSDPVLSLGHALGSLGRAMLLIEHAEGCHHALSRALPEWLRLAPELVFVVSCSRPLSALTERVIEVGGLTAPPAELDGSLGVLKGYDAATLFLRRAVAYHRELLSQHQHTGAIARIASATRGVPLALELLACFCDRLDLALVAQGVAEMVSEHADHQPPNTAQVMAGVLRWIWGQLALTDRATLAQLSCFAGGFDVQAAEAVVELPEDTRQLVAELLEDLSLRGFLSQHGDDDDPRYQLHAALRPFFHAQLRNSGDPVWTGAVRRHAAYFAQMGESNAVDTLAYCGGAWRRGRYLAEMLNLQSALAFAREHVSAEVAAAHARALAGLQSTYGLRSKAAATLMNATAVQQLDSGVRAELDLERAGALLASGRSGPARKLLQQLAQRHARGSGSPLRGHTARLQARAAMAWNEVWSAHGLSAEAVHLAQSSGRSLDIARSRRLLARAAAFIGNLALAHSQLAAASRDAQAIGAPRLEALCLAELGDIERRMAHTAAAQEHLRAALRHCYSLGERRDEARVLALLARIEGDAQAALHLLEQAVGRSRELGDFGLEQELLLQLADRYEDSGRHSQARNALRRAEHLVNRGQDADRMLIELLLRRAQIELRLQQPQAAAEVLRTVQMVGTRSPHIMTARRKRALHALAAQLNAAGSSATAS